MTNKMQQAICVLYALFGQSSFHGRGMVRKNSNMRANGGPTFPRRNSEQDRAFRLQFQFYIDSKRSSEASTAASEVNGLSEASAEEQWTSLCELRSLRVTTRVGGDRSVIHNIDSESEPSSPSTYSSTASAMSTSTSSTSSESESSTSESTSLSQSSGSSAPPSDIEKGSVSSIQITTKVLPLVLVTAISGNTEIGGLFAIYRKQRQRSDGRFRKLTVGRGTYSAQLAVWGSAQPSDHRLKDVNRENGSEDKRKEVIIIDDGEGQSVDDCKEVIIIGDSEQSDCKDDGPDVIYPDFPDC